MKKETYDTVGIVSVLLNEKLDELKAAQTEKESLLEWISSLALDMPAGAVIDKTLAAQIRSHMAANLQRFQKVVREIVKMV